VLSTQTQRGEVDSTRLAGRESGLTTDDTAGDPVFDAIKDALRQEPV
jgi:hypothetical protein